VNDFGGGGVYDGPVGVFTPDALRERRFGVETGPASPDEVGAVQGVLDRQASAVAAGDVEASTPPRRSSLPAPTRTPTPSPRVRWPPRSVVRCC